MNEHVGVSGPYNLYPLDAWRRLVQSQLLLVGPCCPNFHVAPEALKTTEIDFGLPSKKTYLHQGMVTDVDEVTSVGWLFGGMKLIN